MNDCQKLTTPELRLVLNEIAGGNEQSFEQVYHCFYKKLYQFAFAIVKQKMAAEEITEDVFIKIWQNKSKLPLVQNLKVYLYTAIKNTALNYISKQAIENITEAFDNIDIQLNYAVITPEQIMITAEMYKRVRQAVETLPPKCKMIFKLIREDGLKYKEVAEILNISVNTIDAQMAIAVKKLGTSLSMDLKPAARAVKSKNTDSHDFHDQ
jgi:RNA polymerase sigma-70 factor (ECF subfamily)